MSLKIVYSVDGAYYYVVSANPANRARNWLSVEKHLGSVPDERKADPLKGWVEIRTDAGEVYHRELLGFAFWKIKAGETIETDATSELYKDYGAIHNWGEEKVPAPAFREMNRAEAFARAEIDGGRVDMEELRTFLNAYCEARDKADISMEAAAYILLRVKGAVPT